MKLLEMTKSLHRQVRGDLGRPHSHASERVGFVFCLLKGRTLRLTSYTSVPDELYIKDSTVGARINHQAIAMAMKKADHERLGILHVHEHWGTGIPQFSATDLSSHSDFLRAFRTANPNAAHGFLLLSKDTLMARVWLPGESIHRDIFRCDFSGKLSLVRLLRRILQI
ncbi:hypothetical protein [Cohnella panacarvi]|uniref:hypothetical protein n=1 Tax=Cohnella panacarvi TaxID=400776 RepID=UPI00047D009A|nr:hypothetical protein [Cohnella panacarvi]